MKKLIIIIAFLLSGCNVLIKDEPKTGVNYIPIEYNVESIDYIKEYESNEMVWKMKPLRSADVNLEIICPLTDRSDIKVVDLKQNQNDIILQLESKYSKDYILRRPIIKINLKGINPYNSTEYNLKIKSNFDFSNTNLNTRTAKNIVLRNITNINFEPKDIFVTKFKDKINWTLEYPLVLTGNENPVSKMSFIIDDNTQDIVETIQNQNSVKIDKGIPLISFDDYFLYTNLKTLYAYSIPKNKSIKIFDIKHKIDIAKKDIAKNKVYFLSHDNPDKIIVLNFDLTYNEIAFENLNILDFAIHDDKLFLVSKDSEAITIYKYTDELKEIKTTKEIVKNIETNGEDLVVELKAEENNSIYRIYKNGESVFIGNGTKPLIDKSSIYYISYKDNPLNSYFTTYTLNSGLSSSHLCNSITDIYNDGKIIIKENVEGITKLSTFQNNIINEIIQFSRESIYYLSKHNSIVLVYKNNIHIIIISN